MEDEEGAGQFVSFMGKLSSLCWRLDKEVSQLKEEINQQPGEKPYHYNAAMKKMKTDVEELKTSSAEAKSKLVLMENFSSFLETTSELVNEQEKSISSMEEYLKKFGYQPLEISSETNCEKIEAIENGATETNSEEVRSQRPSAGNCSSPVLSDVGQSVIQGADLTQDISHIVKQTIHISLKENPTFKISNNEIEHGHQNLMEEKQTNDLETNDCSGRPIPFPIKNNSFNMNEQKKSMDEIPKSLPRIKAENPSTPVTPELSEATMSLFDLLSKKANIDHNETVTPEEPSLCYKETNKSLNDTRIPDEPVLSNVYGEMKEADTPESPDISEATKSLFKYISSANASKKIFKTPVNYEYYNATTEYSNLLTSKDNVGNSEMNTPEEPSLKCDYSSKDSYHQKDTPEEPILSSAVTSNNDDDMPPSPELSSYTKTFLQSQTHDRRKILYDTNRYESTTDKEYPNENMNRSYKTNDYPSGGYTNQVKPHMYANHTRDEYLDQENEEPTSYINNSSYMNKSSGASNFSFITPAKERGNVNRSYSIAMERIANQNDSPESPQLSDISMSVVNRSQRW